MRCEVFYAVIRLPFEFYGYKGNSPKDIKNLISKDLRNINGASVELLVIWIQAVAATMIGAGVMFIYSWKIALVVASAIPFLII